MTHRGQYIWQELSWPEFRWDSTVLLKPLGDRRFQQGSLLTQMRELGFEGGMTNRKYAGITHISRATAQRELADLVSKGILRRNPGGGRNASYDLV